MLPQIIQTFGNLKALLQRLSKPLSGTRWWTDSAWSLQKFPICKAPLSIMSNSQTHVFCSLLLEPAHPSPSTLGGGGGGHCLVEGRYPLPNHAFRHFLPLNLFLPSPIFEGHKPPAHKIKHSQCKIIYKSFL